MILVDTSVWIDHLRHGSDRLAAHLSSDTVCCHPAVIGELACETLRSRQEVLTLLAELPQATVATHNEVLAFLEAHRLMGNGLGYVDLHLLASAALDRCRIWTLDKPLARSAASLGLAG